MSRVRLLFPKKPCEEAIRKWIDVRVRHQVPLQGGVSGTKIYFVDTEIGFPGLEEEHPSKPLQFVIKYSPGQSFRKEREKFENLPKPLRKWFVDFAAQDIPVDGDFFMVMPYLGEHKTFAYMVHHGSDAQVQVCMQKVWEALESIHFCVDDYRDPRKRQKADFGKLIDMYLESIQASLKGVNHIADIFPKIRSTQFKANNMVFYPPSLYLEKLFEESRGFLPCFSTWTHGDCHSRNIMIRQRGSDCDLRFIDIDNLKYDGDYLYDFGVLISDIEIYNRVLQVRRPNFHFEAMPNGAFKYVLPEVKSTRKVVKFLRRNVQEIAEEIKDENWEQRLSLSMARYLLNMVTKTLDREKAFVTYCEGLKVLSSLFNPIA